MPRLLKPRHARWGAQQAGVKAVSQTPLEQPLTPLRSMKLKQNRYSSIVGHASKRLALAVIATLSGLTLSQPAHASNITVASPVNGTTTSTSVWVRAHTVGCNGLAPVVFGYSIDNNSTLHRGVTKYDVDATKVPFGAGTHTIHFKAWTTNGICPVASTTFKVGGSS